MPLFTNKDIDINKVIWVGMNTKLPAPIAALVDYPVSPHDKMVWEFWLGHKKAMFFQGGFALEKMRLMMKQVLGKLSERGEIEKVHQYRPIEDR